MDYADDDSNFATLDSFTRERGLDWEAFVKGCRRKTPCSSAVLITPPISPHSAAKAMSSKQAPPTSSSCPEPTTPVQPVQDVTPPPTTPSRRDQVPPTTPVRPVPPPSPGVIPAKCTITAGFASPKRGALCLVPVKIPLGGKDLANLEGDSANHTPPVSSSSHPSLTPTRSGCRGSLKRGRRKKGACAALPSIKRLRMQQSPERSGGDGGVGKGGSVVPETPEKDGGAAARNEEGQRTPRSGGSSSLCNIHNLLCRAANFTTLQVCQLLSQYSFPS